MPKRGVFVFGPPKKAEEENHSRMVKRKASPGACSSGKWARPTPVLFWASQLRKISSGQIAFLAPVMKSYLDSFGLIWI